jgi:hypothetical protein
VTGPGDNNSDSFGVEEITVEGFDASTLWRALSRPQVPWYRTTRAITAVVGIAAGLVMLVVSTTLLLIHRGEGDGTEPARGETPPSSSTTASPGTTGAPTPAPSTPQAPPPSSAEGSAPSTSPDGTPEPAPGPPARRGAIGGRGDGL